mmetsp:Transcript_112745/g.318671  ORF Transcript_112745/g.318671 Transcript_112745/m.318671 type:complete len:236 (-) Transcript_112745:1166-1873(-)
MSVTMSLASGAVHAPISVKPLRYSQPRAPQPTKKILCFRIFSIMSEPTTAAWYVYLLPEYAPTPDDPTRQGSSWWIHCSIGVNLPVFLITSCAIAPPRKAQRPVSSACINLLKRANFASTLARSSAAKGSPLRQPHSTVCSQQAPSSALFSSLIAFAMFTNSAASASSPSPGHLPLVSLNFRAAASARCTQQPSPERPTSISNICGLGRYTSVFSKDSHSMVEDGLTEFTRPPDW